MENTSSLHLNGIYSETLNGLTLQSGDLICTTSGMPDILVGEFWRILGRLVPGEVDHVIVYAGPEGLCLEAGQRGVISFHFSNSSWNSESMMTQRGPYVDTLVGIAYPLSGRALSVAQESLIRQKVRHFCLEQARMRKPYNLNFKHPDTDDAFYCSQLPYLAYLPHGIDLNTGLGVPDLAGSEKIIFPQEIWTGCVHEAAPIVPQAEPGG